MHVALRDVPRWLARLPWLANLRDLLPGAARLSERLIGLSARRRLLSVEKVVPTDELVKSVVPQQLLINRMMVDTVVEAPNGSHFTTNEPDYRRDEKFQRHYAEAAGSPETWTEFVKTYLSGSEDDYQAAVRKFKEAQA